MGVDAFRLDTEKHISRWTLNNAFFPAFDKYENFFIFGEVCARVRDVWNHGLQSDSCPFYGWKETESALLPVLRLEGDRERMDEQLVQDRLEIQL